MPTLAPQQAVTLAGGKDLVISAPKKTSNQGCPTLTNAATGKKITIFLPSVPKKVPLAKGVNYIFKADSMSVTYTY